VRNGSVIDLQITKGKITAQVSGSEIYTETITIKPLASARWESIKQKCAGRIDSLVDLLKGTLSDAVMRVITDRDHGLFPAPAEIEKNCSCPDVAGLCKHLAAVLYGVGARLDTQPELLFLLRGVDHRELIAAAAAGATQLAPADAAAGTTAALSESQLADVFGIDIAPVAHSATPASPPPPANPASTKPAKPTKPVTPTKPAKLAKPAKSAKSAKPAKIAKTAKTACAKKPSTRSSSPSPAKKLPARKKNARKAKKPRKKNTAPNVAQT
jgi:uncharacterized Zn finger protein